MSKEKEKEKEQGISIRSYLEVDDWYRDQWGHSGALTDWALFDELKKGTLPEAFADAILDELRADAESVVNRTRGARKGGQKGGGKNKIDPAGVKKAFDAMTQPERNRASVLAQRFGVTPTTIRNALKKAQSM